MVHHPILTPIKVALDKSSYRREVNTFLRQYDKKYRKRHCGITTLCKSPRQRYLEERHSKEIILDAEEQINLLIGTAFHDYIKRKVRTLENCQAEKRLGYIEPHHDYLVHHAFDLYYNGMYGDWKTVTTNALNYPHPGWEEEVNFGAYLIEKNLGLSVDEIFILAVCKDWTPTRRNKDDYPFHSIQVVPIEKWSKDDVEDFVYSKVSQHLQNVHLKDDELDYCSASEKWQDPDKFKIYPYKANGEVSSKGVAKTFETEIEAKNHCRESNIQGYEIKRIRCAPINCRHFCNVRNICSQRAEEEIPF